ncbi:MAG: hypothetical protein V4725_17400 [Bacteroidota bacterium]
MNVRFFLASLVFLLFGGSVHAFAGPDVHAEAALSAQKNTRFVLANTLYEGWDKITQGNSGVPDEVKILFYEDVAEEDENDSADKNLRLITGFHAIASYHSALPFLQHSSRAIPTSWYPVSPRYIIHRNLRI